MFTRLEQAAGRRKLVQASMQVKQDKQVRAAELVLGLVQAIMQVRQEEQDRAAELVRGWRRPGRQYMGQKFHQGLFKMRCVLVDEL